MLGLILCTKLRLSKRKIEKRCSQDILKCNVCFLKCLGCAKKLFFFYYGNLYKYRYHLSNTQDQC